MTAYRSSLFTGVAILAISGAAQAQSPAPAQINFSIPAGSLAAALNAYASPVFGHLLVADVDTGLVVKCLAPIWESKTETASRVRGRIESVC